MLLDIISSGGRVTDTPKTFGQHLLEWLAREGMSQLELGRRIGKSHNYIHLLVKDSNPSAKGGKPIMLRPEVVDKIAEVLNVPRAVARDAAGLASGETEQKLDADVERLLRFYSDLPHECQKDVLALTEALWRRRRAEGRAERRNLTHVSDLPAVAEFPNPAQAEPESPRKKRRA